MNGRWENPWKGVTTAVQQVYPDPSSVTPLNRNSFDISSFGNREVAKKRRKTCR